MISTDLHVVTQMYHDAQSECSHLRMELELAREHARRWESEAKSLRKEIQRLRMDCDTERIAK
jgi:hypothetical protein